MAASTSEGDTGKASVDTLDGGRRRCSHLPGAQRTVISRGLMRMCPLSRAGPSAHSYLRRPVLVGRMRRHGGYYSIRMKPTRGYSGHSGRSSTRWCSSNSTHVPGNHTPCECLYFHLARHFFKLPEVKYARVAVAPRAEHTLQLLNCRSMCRLHSYGVVNDGVAHLAFH